MMTHSELWDELRFYTRTWARHGIYWGTGWRVEEWTGSAVCLEFGPYVFPSHHILQGIINRIPRDVPCLVRMNHESLIYRFSYGHPDRAKRGEQNRDFLNASLFCANIVPHLDVLTLRPVVMVLPVARIFRTDNVVFEKFVGSLGSFLDGLPPACTYAVECGNTEYLLPDYIACVNRKGVLHALTMQRESASGAFRVQHPGVVTARGAVVRVMVGEDKGGDVRDGVCAVVRRALDEHTPLYVHVGADTSVRSERSTLRIGLFLLAVMRQLDQDLAKLSPIRRHAA